MRKIDKDELKEKLSIYQIFDLLDDLGAEPTYNNDRTVIYSKTICHCGDSHKLYYYENTHMFKCYTNCNKAFDVFDLVAKHKNSLGEKKTSYINGHAETRPWNLGDGLQYVAYYFNYSDEFFITDSEKISDWDYFNFISNNKLEDKRQIIELKKFDDDILNRLNHRDITEWYKDGITQEVMDYCKICFDLKNYGIVIPHYDIENNLIGIRERTLIDDEEQFGKYRPAIFNGTMYNHPLGLNLYNLNNSKNNIRKIGKAIVFEGEKGCLQYSSAFGIDNDISVATCGSHITEYQMMSLLKLDVNEVIIAFDRQFKEIGDKDYKKWIENLLSIKKKYGAYTQISYIFDINNRLPYKASPIDLGKEIFTQMFIERITV